MDVRRLLLLTAAACLLLAGCASGVSHARNGAGSAGTSAAARQLHTTVTHTFRPFDASGRLTKPVAHRTAGHCWEASLAAPSATSYRCLASNTILDPCFAPKVAKPKTVACFSDPWAKAVVLTLRHKLPHSAPVTARPWAVALAGGAHCVAATGTAPFVHGVGLDYTCDDGTAAALRGTGAHVRALVGQQGGHTLVRVPVTDLWRA